MKEGLETKCRVRVWGLTQSLPKLGFGLSLGSRPIFGLDDNQTDTHTHLGLPSLQKCVYEIVGEIWPI